MKKAQTIISHLLNKPAFQNASKAKCLDMLVYKALPKNLTRFISFYYIKNNSLFLAITHPGVKMELYYKANLLKSILTMLKKAQPECEHIHFSDIKVFITKKVQHQDPVDKDLDTVPRYSEHATPFFQNLATDENLIQKFEAIREEIRKNSDA